MFKREFSRSIFLRIYLHQRRLTFAISDMKENTEYLELFIIVDKSKFHAKSRKLIVYHRVVLFGKNDMFSYCFNIGKYSNILISDKTENGPRKLNRRDI